MWSWWQSKTRLADSTAGIEDEMPNVHRQEIIRTIREMQLKNIDEAEDELMDAAARGRGRGRAPAKRKPQSRSRSTSRKKPRAKPRSKSAGRGKPKYRCTGNKCVRVRSETPGPVHGGVRNSRLLANVEQTKAAPEPAPTSPWTPVTTTPPLPPSSPAPRRVPTKLPPKRPLRPKNPYIGTKPRESTPPKPPLKRTLFGWRKAAATPPATPVADNAGADVPATSSGANVAPAPRSASLPRMARQDGNKRDGDRGPQQRALSLPRNKRVPVKRAALPTRKAAAANKGKAAKKKTPVSGRKGGRK